jgi:hypothetical protein
MLIQTKSARETETHVRECDNFCAAENAHGFGVTPTALIQVKICWSRLLFRPRRDLFSLANMCNASDRYHTTDVSHEHYCYMQQNGLDTLPAARVHKVEYQCT